MHMAEIGMEAPKIGFGQRVREAFTRRGAEQKWLREHQDTIRQYFEVNKNLTDEQRVGVMSKIESDAQDEAKSKVRKHWGALALTTATLAGAGTLIARPDFAKRIMDAKITIKGKEFGTGKLGKGLFEGAEISHNFLVDVWKKASTLSKTALDKGKEFIGQWKASPTTEETTKE